MNWIKRKIMITEVQIFTDYVTKDIVKRSFPNVNYVNFLNNLNLAARMLKRG